MTMIPRDPHFERYTPSTFAPEYPDLVVIVGAARSGTTMLSYLLRECFHAPAYGEIQNIISVYRRLSHFGDLRSEENLRRLTSELARDAYFLNGIRLGAFKTEDFHARVKDPTYTGVLYTLLAYVTEIAQPDAPFLSYKFPPDVLYMDLIAKLLPSARFIHLIRDGRDVMMSLRAVKRLWGAKTVWSGMRYWKDSVDAGRRYGQALGKDRYFELRYEDLLTQPEQTAPAFVEFVCRQPNAKIAAGVVDYVGKNAKSSRVYAWKSKLSPQEITLSEAVAWESLKAFGYEVTHAQKPPLSPIVVAGSLVKDVTLRGTNRLRRFLNSIKPKKE